MINLYIDTNAYLTFYHLTRQDLNELEKLELLTDEKSGKIKLHLPDQTREEFQRNRETKIVDGLKKLSEAKLSSPFPLMCKSYHAYSKMQNAIKHYEKSKFILLENLKHDALNNNLAADKIISKLFKNATQYETTNEILLEAKKRVDIGKPPGKNKSLGDAINWETLLKALNPFEELYFVSDDKDYYSEIDESYFNPYLKSEWEDKTLCGIQHYRTISEFFKDKFPQIKLVEDYRKDILITKLSESSSFASSRSILQSLSKFETFSSSQLNQFLLAFKNNNQIKWIAEDDDIKEIITAIVKQGADKIETSLLAFYNNFYNPPISKINSKEITELEDDELPF